MYKAEQAAEVFDETPSPFLRLMIERLMATARMKTLSQGRAISRWRTVLPGVTCCIRRVPPVGQKVCSPRCPMSRLKNGRAALRRCNSCCSNGCIKGVPVACADVPRRPTSILLATSHRGDGRIDEHFDAEDYLKFVDQYKVTHSQLVPTMFVRMLKLDPEVRAKYDVSTLEAAVHGRTCPVSVSIK